MLVLRENPNPGDLRLGEFVCQCLKQVCCAEDFEVHVDQEVTIMNQIVSFRCSARFRPDNCVCLKLGRQTVPILDMEVQSSSFENAVSKNVANITALLRFLRHTNCDVRKLSGFTIPYPKKDDKGTHILVEAPVQTKIYKLSVDSSGKI